MSQGGECKKGSETDGNRKYLEDRLLAHVTGTQSVTELCGRMKRVSVPGVCDWGAVPDGALWKDEGGSRCREKSLRLF